MNFRAFSDSINSMSASDGDPTGDHTCARSLPNSAPLPRTDRIHDEFKLMLVVVPGEQGLPGDKLRQDTPYRPYVHCARARAAAHERFCARAGTHPRLCRAGSRA